VSFYQSKEWGDVIERFILNCQGCGFDAASAADCDRGQTDIARSGIGDGDVAQADVPTLLASTLILTISAFDPSREATQKPIALLISSGQHWRWQTHSRSS
jgi:hypothetical protein